MFLVVVQVQKARFFAFDLQCFKSIAKKAFIQADRPMRIKQFYEHGR